MLAGGGAGAAAVGAPPDVADGANGGGSVEAGAAAAGPAVPVGREPRPGQPTVAGTPDNVVVGAA